MQMKRVFSSHIDAVGYDPNSKELHVQFRGKGGKAGETAVYIEVPADAAAMVVDAPSVGTALHAHVRGKFAHGYKRA